MYAFIAIKYFSKILKIIHAGRGRRTILAWPQSNFWNLVSILDNFAPGGKTVNKV